MIIMILYQKIIIVQTMKKKIDIIIPALILTIPCGLSFLCLMSLMVYTLVKPLINNK